MAPKQKATGPKPVSTNSTVTRSTSLSGISAPEPLDSPQSPINSALSEKSPLNAHTAKAFLCRAGLLESTTEVYTAGLCSNILNAIAYHPGTPQTVSALICCVDLLLPEAFALVCNTNAQLSDISDKLDALLSNSNKEPAVPSPPVLAELGEKLDIVTKNIQKATETWQTVPVCSHTRSPPPATAPASVAAPVGPTRTDISRSRRIQSQGCFILVEPTSDAIRESFDGLNARTLVQKADFAWEAAWNVVKDSDTAKDLKLTTKPRMVFKAALRLPRGGIRYELDDRTQAALLSDARIASEFEKGFGGATCKGQGATILLQCAPVEFSPEDPAAIGRFEDENKLSKGDVLSMTWCKPPHKRKPEQTMAVLKLEMRSHDLADRLITEGGQLEYSRVLFRKSSQEPMRCLRCQKFGHKAANCKNGPGDVCSQCGGAHRIANCTDGDKKWCVSCQSNAHCSFDRECPTFRDECTRFNTRRPENRSALFGPPRPYDPRNRPINYQSFQLTPDMLIGGDRSSLFSAQRQDIRSLGRRHNWVNRERPRKERGQGESWDIESVVTPLLATVSGSNAIFVHPTRLSQVPADSLIRELTPPPRVYSPSAPEPATPQGGAEFLGIPATPVRPTVTYLGLPFSVSPARPCALPAASTTAVTQ